MARKKKSNKPEDPIVKELFEIKRLLMALMYKLGSSLTEVAEALQMDTADASRMLPARKIKSIINK
jgi:DNA-directed RNA polymerase specialized sigma subunit